MDRIEPIRIDTREHSFTVGWQCKICGVIFRTPARVNGPVQRACTCRVYHFAAGANGSKYSGPIEARGSEPK